MLKSISYNKEVKFCSLSRRNTWRKFQASETVFVLLDLANWTERPAGVNQSKILESLDVGGHKSKKLKLLGNFQVPSPRWQPMHALNVVNRNLALKFLVEITDHQGGVIKSLLDHIKLSSGIQAVTWSSIKIYFQDIDDQSNLEELIILTY